MKRLLAALAVLALLASTWSTGAGFHERLLVRMERKVDNVFDWIEWRGATGTCVRMTVEGTDPDGEVFGWAAQVCQ